MVKIARITTEHQQQEETLSFFFRLFERQTPPDASTTKKTMKNETGGGPAHVHQLPLWGLPSPQRQPDEREGAQGERLHGGQAYQHRLGETDSKDTGFIFLKALM